MNMSVIVKLYSSLPHVIEPSLIFFNLPWVQARIHMFLLCF